MYPYNIVTKFDTYTNSEKLFLKDWVENSSYIQVRQSYKNNKSHEILDNMFTKYDSKYTKSLYIYRGMYFKKEDEAARELYYELNTYFTDAYNSEDTIRIDYAPSSFSLNKLIAENFSKYYDTYYFSIIYKVQFRIMNEIDVCSDEHVIYNKEAELILQSHKMLFKILKLTQYNDILEIELKEI